MEFTKEELERIKGLLDEEFDRLLHEKHDDSDAFWSLSDKFQEEFKAAGFWWAR